MQEWISYFGEIIVVVAVAGVLYTASPDGKTKKYVQFVLSLCVLCATVFPVLSLAEDLPKRIESFEKTADGTQEKSDEALTELLVEASKEEIEMAITDLICAKFDYPRSAVNVFITLDARDREAIEITAVTVRVSPLTAQTKIRIKEYLEEIFLGETAVSVLEGEEGA